MEEQELKMKLNDFDTKMVKHSQNRIIELMEMKERVASQNHSSALCKNFD